MGMVLRQRWFSRAVKGQLPGAAVLKHNLDGTAGVGQIGQADPLFYPLDADAVDAKGMSALPVDVHVAKVVVDAVPRLGGCAVSPVIDGERAHALSL